MSDLFPMGGYGFYVWTSYGLFVAVLVWDFVAPILRERAALRQLELKLKRQATRTST